MVATLSARSMPVGISTRRVSRGAASVRCQSQVGDKVLPMLRGPADILFLGPRVALGALLSTSQNLERLPQDIERLSTLATDPRPMEEKQNELLLELEDRVASFIERGLVAENEVINAVNEVIPEEVKSALPEEVRKLALTPRPIPSAEADSWTNQPAPGYGNDAAPMATWTITSMDEDDSEIFGSSNNTGTSTSSNSTGQEADNEPPASAATVAASQAAAELVEIQSAVLFVKDQLAALNSNTDASRTSMLKLNLREAAQSLERRLEQRAVPAAASADPAVAAAVDEANALLSEVQNLLL